MNVTVTAKTPISHAHRILVTDRISERIERHPDVEWVSIVVDRSAVRIHEMTIQAKIGLHHGQLHLHEKGSEIPDTIDLFVNKMDRCLTQHRDRVREHKGHSSVRTMEQSPLMSSHLL